MAQVAVIRSNVVEVGAEGQVIGSLTLPYAYLVGNFDKTTQQAANTNLFPYTQSQAAASKAPCVFRIYAVFDTAGGNLVVVRSKNQQGINPNPVLETLNGAASPSTLLANYAYEFDVPVDSTDYISLQYTANAIPLTLRIHEIDFQTG